MDHTLLRRMASALGCLVDDIENLIPYDEDDTIGNDMASARELLAEFDRSVQS